VFDVDGNGLQPSPLRLTLVSAAGRIIESDRTRIDLRGVAAGTYYL
jgi:hypothetical protein